MKHVRPLHPAVFVPALLLGIGVFGCARSEPAAVEPKSPAPVAQPAAAESEVKFEPAYPTEVSAEGLAEKDVAQQQTPHSHDGGAVHAHGDSTEHAEEEKDHGHPH